MRIEKKEVSGQRLSRFLLRKRTVYRGLNPLANWLIFPIEKLCVRGSNRAALVGIGLKLWRPRLDLNPY